ncbi:tRNA N6-adenosine threonylcarbamoyltransferase, mitochondrial-like [Oppia nitens]|uniref:tRNA N6-adenosine threonylcarbamoyltransferase, mitochondrial-like n=1 Tax=Oppia nitens TaxID=1686743 RepID=UPI0023DC2EA8|nr:tRNA N6-adenosine threonylcarbamoyltransferase, mitochondrial-like [Oppia nitens]
MKQLKTHLSNGGIIPPVARVLHQECIDDCVRQALQQASVSPANLSAIAVTLRPGLPTSLIIGKNYAKALAIKYSLPVIPIHHMEAHALMATIDNDINFPFVTLLISGGHCLLAIVRNINKFELLGNTQDIAPGDLMDKISRRLRLKNFGQPYNEISGGAALELCAKTGNPFEYFTDVNKYPTYTSLNRNCGFSFSGFETMTIRLIERLEKETDIEPDRVLPQANNICASLQYAITFMFIKRLQRAFIFIRDNNLFDNKPIKLVISGGCASNQFITDCIRNYCQTEDIEVIVPHKRLCGDNGVMIAWNGILKLVNENKFSDSIIRSMDSIKKIDILAKAPFGEDISNLLISQHIKCDTIDVKKFIKLT